MRRAIVVFPVPGLPVKHIWSDGASALIPIAGGRARPKGAPPLRGCGLDRNQSDQLAFDLDEGFSMSRQHRSREVDLIDHGNAFDVTGYRVFMRPSVVSWPSARGNERRRWRYDGRRLRSGLPKSAADNEGVGAGLSHARMLSSFTPPSTSSRMARRPPRARRSAPCRPICAALRIRPWPPKPGLTHMIRIRSTGSSLVEYVDRLAGLNARPGGSRRSRISARVRSRCVAGLRMYGR